MIPMQPFDHAWRLLKSFTSGPARKDLENDPPLSAHFASSPSEWKIGAQQPVPKTFENRQFNVKDIEDEDTKGRVRDTRQELEAANFSTGQDMSDRQYISEKGSREEDPDDYDHRSKIDGMRVNENPNYPSLSYDDMSAALRYPYPKDANNPGDFAGGY